MEVNLLTALDEFIVLHARIANELLNEFPTAYGVKFVVDRDPASAYATADVPAGYADGYTDDALEARSTTLLAEIGPRVKEIMASVSSIGVAPRDFYVSARRTKLEGQLQKSAYVTGAITGGLGAAFVRRTVLSANKRVLCHEPAEFHVVGIVEDASAAPAIQEAGNRGLHAGMTHLVERGLLLNQAADKTRMLLDWTAHFPQADGTCEFSYDNPVCRLISRSDDTMPQLYFPLGTIREKDMASGIIEYDPILGFADVRQRTQTAVPTSAP